MKIKLLSLLLLSCGFIFAQTPCVNGFAGPYPCEGYDLQSQIDLNVLDAGLGNDSWGWTDPDTEKEYAIMCLSNGTAFIDISDPVNPIYLGKLPTQTGSSTWRDAKVYNNFAFIVSDVNSGQHGMQIFDLTRLRNVNNPQLYSIMMLTMMVLEIVTTLSSMKKMAMLMPWVQILLAGATYCKHTRPFKPCFCVRI